MPRLTITPGFSRRIRRDNVDLAPQQDYSLRQSLTLKFLLQPTNAVNWRSKCQEIQKRNIQNYQIEGRNLSEFEYAKNQEEIA
jgi:hypothetical protein